MKSIWAILFAGFATTAHADLFVEFIEGAPKDRFLITNVAHCDLPEFEIHLDLSTSQAGLIFDVTSLGAGVEVFQPLELIGKTDRVLSVTQLMDGDNMVSLNMTGLKSGEMVGFTIDVDDTAGAVEITVAGSEISGALVKANILGKELSDPFDQNGASQIIGLYCNTNEA